MKWSVSTRVTFLLRQTVSACMAVQLLSAGKLLPIAHPSANADADECSAM